MSTSTVMPLHNNRPEQPLLSCVVPVYNEAEHILDFVQDLENTLKLLLIDYEIILVNDGSKDHTHEKITQILSHPGICYLNLSRNFGKEAALSAGIDQAQGDAVLLIDSDYQHPLSLIPQMLKHWQEGVDMVYGVISDRRQESFLKRAGTGVFYRLMSIGSRIEMPRNAGDFRLMDKKVVDALKKLPEKNRFMKGLYAWVGFSTLALPFVPDKRATGQSSFNIRNLGNLALSGMTAFTTLPLRFWAATGVGVSILALLYGLWIVLSALLFGTDVPGWSTLAAGLMLFSGIQLISIGVLGEYIGRIYEEVKCRPIYLLKDQLHSGVARHNKLQKNATHENTQVRDSNETSKEANKDEVKDAE